MRTSYIIFRRETLRDETIWKKLGAEGKILKWNLKKQDGRGGLDSCGLG
jgi:hypothetical protein